MSVFGRVIGFTGTRHAMTAPQKRALREIMKGVTVLHHGDCVGADAAAYAIAKELGAKTVGHPPDNPILRAFTKNDDQRAPEPYQARNRSIVIDSEELVACPRHPTEHKKSGTWATIRFARKRGKRITIIKGSGKVYIENADVFDVRRLRGVL